MNIFECTIVTHKTVLYSHKPYKTLSVFFFLKHLHTIASCRV